MPEPLPFPQPKPVEPGDAPPSVVTVQARPYHGGWTPGDPGQLLYRAYREASLNRALEPWEALCWQERQVWVEAAQAFINEYIDGDDW
jgi:hypothetical protein